MMKRLSGTTEYHGCNIPPEIYEIAFGWDPAPEVHRLLFIARSLAVPISSALELGCGTGRLLADVRRQGVEVMGLELSPSMAQRASHRSAVPVHIGDMSEFSLDRRFDLIYASANTIRHVVETVKLARMWRSIHRHLNPGGLLIVDLELGQRHQAEKIGKPDHWTISRDERTVHVIWSVTDVNLAESRTRIRWTFELRDRQGRREWSEEFDLRTDDGPAFVAQALEAGLSFAEMYEIRDPYLIPTAPERAAGRMLAAFRRPGPAA